VRHANQLPHQAAIVEAKRCKPHWGARKIRELFLRATCACPAKSTIHAVVDRHGLVKRISKRRARHTGTPLSQAATPNDLWCADFKGEVKLGEEMILSRAERPKPPSCSAGSQPASSPAVVECWRFRTEATLTACSHLIALKRTGAAGQKVGGVLTHKTLADFEPRLR